MLAVSVIIPNYNHGHFLKQRIDSVLQQTYEGFEVIILDDCSKDNSREVIEMYRSHPKVTNIIYNEANSGSTFKQWQKGIEVSIGQYIWIAESDDWCEPTLVEDLMQGIKKNENVVISYCGSIVLNELNEVIYLSNSSKLGDLISGINFIKEDMTEINQIINASMCIFSRFAYQKITSEYIHYKFCGDWLFWMMIAQHGNVYKSGKYLNYFRKHSNDISGRSMIDGTYYKEFPLLMQYLLDKNFVNQQQFSQLIFSKYKKLKKSNINHSIKQEMISWYKNLIGTASFNRYQTADFFHKNYIKLWTVTPFILKNIFRKITGRTKKLQNA